MKRRSVPAHVPSSAMYSKDVRKKLGLKSYNHSGGYDRSHFFSGDSDTFLSGWETNTHSIDFYLKSELRKIQSRCRKTSRKNPFGSRYVTLLRSNVVGSDGFRLKSSVTFGNKKPDRAANSAIQDAWRDFCKKGNVDVEGKRSMKEFCKTVIASTAYDGTFIIEVIVDPKSKYGLKLRLLDAALLDTDKNEPALSGGEIRLGVEYDKSGKVVKYWFKERDFVGNYGMGRSYSKNADSIIFGFIPIAANQSLGVPLMTAGLETCKHLEKFAEAALVRARVTANRIAAVGTHPDAPYRGDAEGKQSDNFEYDISSAGEVWDLGPNHLQQLDAKYPDQMYAPFVVRNVMELATAWNVSYQALASDPNKTSFSSGRTSTLEEREFYKDLQDYVIEQFLVPVYEQWFALSYLKGAITINGKRLSKPVDEYLKYKFKGRRWSWVDPAKDMSAAETSIRIGIKSRRMVIEETSTEDPDEIFDEIMEEREMLGDIDQVDDVEDQDEDDD